MKAYILILWPEVLIIALIIGICLICWLQNSKKITVEKKNYKFVNSEL